MSSRMTPKGEILKIINMMRAVPRKEDEPHNSYYRRLIACGVEKSRATLQLVEKAMEHTDDDDEIYCMYCDMSRSRDHNKKRNKLTKGQISIDDCAVNTEEPGKEPKEEPKDYGTQREETLSSHDIVMNIGSVAICAINAMLRIYEGRQKHEQDTEL